MVNRIRAEIDKHTLSLVPNADGSEIEGTINSEFRVIVTNDSREFASFQLELTTPGIESDAVVNWYKVEPEVCTKKPPGASTPFRVAIVRSPLPIYDETIDVLVHVISVEFPHLRTIQKLRLTIGKPQQPLSLVLPNKEFKASPGDRVDIPVVLYNSSPKAIETTLVCSGLEPEWLNSHEQTLWVEPGHPSKATFSCKLPPDPQLLKQSIPFTIEARSKIRQRFPTERGVLEVLPLGVINFDCPSTFQQIPTQREWKKSFWKQRNTKAVYDLELKNGSNTLHRVEIKSSETDCQELNLTLPDPVTLNPGDRSALQLISHKVRPWVGLPQRFRFHAAAQVIDPNTGDESDRIRALPTQHTLDLRVLPIIPLWLLLASGLLLLLLFWLYTLLHPSPHHKAPVNSVRLDGNASNVFSGSSDQSILRWQVDHDFWQVPNPRLKYEGSVGANLGKAVRVLRVNPTDNNLIAVGLENGAIELWNVSENRQQKRLFSDNDRVFDLDFTKDSVYLFSGHGSSRVRQWDLNSQTVRPTKTITTNFTISSLAVDKTENSTWVAIAGQYNQLALWNWQQNRTYHVPYLSNSNSNDPSTQYFSSIAGQHHYIESIALNKNLLVTADNAGLITIWDWQKRQCSTPSSLISNNLKGESSKDSSALKTAFMATTKETCSIPILDQWADGHDGKAVRSVAVTQDEQHAYLASAGDDGRVKL